MLIRFSSQWRHIQLYETYFPNPTQQPALSLSLSLSLSTRGQLILFFVATLFQTSPPLLTAFFFSPSRSHVMLFSFSFLSRIFFLLLCFGHSKRRPQPYSTPREKKPKKKETSFHNTQNSFPTFLVLLNNKTKKEEREKCVREGNTILSDSLANAGAMPNRTGDTRRRPVPHS